MPDNRLEDPSRVTFNRNAPLGVQPPSTPADVEDLELRYGSSPFDLLDSDDIDLLKASGKVWLPAQETAGE